MSRKRPTKQQRKLRREILWYTALTASLLLFVLLVMPGSGISGAVQSFTMGLLGYAAYALPFLLAALATVTLLDRYQKTRQRLTSGLLLLFAALMIFVTASGKGFRSLDFGRSYQLGGLLDGGGILGDIVGFSLSFGLGSLPLYMIAFTLGIVSVVVLAQESLLDYIAFLRGQSARRPRADEPPVPASKQATTRISLDEGEEGPVSNPISDVIDSFFADDTWRDEDDRPSASPWYDRFMQPRSDDASEQPNLIDHIETYLRGSSHKAAPRRTSSVFETDSTLLHTTMRHDTQSVEAPDMTDSPRQSQTSGFTHSVLRAPERPEEPRKRPTREHGDLSGYSRRKRRAETEAAQPSLPKRDVRDNEPADYADEDSYVTFTTLHLPRDFDTDEGSGTTGATPPAPSVEREVTAKSKTVSQPKKVSNKKAPFYRLPGLDLLDKPQADSSDALEHTQSVARKLETTLQSFHVDAEVRSFKRGPAITMFEVVLSPGVKMSKVQSLADDIALSLAASQVRIAPIAGKSAVGIEVPNRTSSMVRLREIIDSPEFKQSASKLTMALGKDIAGNPIIGDLAAMPHLLIAGATGSGKSVCVNTIISSILFHAAPSEVQFLMIDPKIVELSGYNGIPHLIMPVVTDPKKAAIALNWAVQEMERRYTAFSDYRVKDLKSFNQKVEESLQQEVPSGEMPPQRMPQIVVIIDELADLMMAAPKQVEDAICRIAQKARAAGIHLIVATQRPSVDVITGLIKANIPSRIAFAVSSQVDSRTIIDMQGAEKLLGKGDMLYYPSSAPKPRRVQGAFMSDHEVEAMVAFVSSQQVERTGDEIVLEEAASFDGGEEEVDDLLSDAIQFVLESGMASASSLQRRYRIGYNRAARLIDSMEERGIVGPNRGSKPREILTRSYDE